MEDRIDDLSDMKVNALEGSPGLDIEPTEWSAPLVGNALTFAFDVLRRMPNSGGPRAFGQAMPNYVYSKEDMWFQKSQIEEEYRKRQESRNRVIIRPTSEEISRMYMVFDWMAYYRTIDRHGAMVIQSIAAGRAVGKSVERVCRRFNWAYSSAKKIRKTALSDLSDYLNRQSVIPFACHINHER